MTWDEYLGSHASIPLEAPIGYVYNKLKRNGASSMHAMTIEVVVSQMLAATNAQHCAASGMIAGGRHRGIAVE